MPIVFWALIAPVSRGYTAAADTSCSLRKMRSTLWGVVRLASPGAAGCKTCSLACGSTFCGTCASPADQPRDDDHVEGTQEEAQHRRQHDAKHNQRPAARLQHRDAD